MKKKTEKSKKLALATTTLRRLAMPKLTDVAGGGDSVPGDYIVVFKDNVSP